MPTPLYAFDLYPSLMGAACAEEQHRLLWALSRERHFRKMAERPGGRPKCVCHGASPTLSTSEPDWDSYWWDASTPDVEYALNVCHACPVRQACLRARPDGASGVWGGRVFRRMRGA